ncbi:hypothetical protein [Prosthecobacter sp.]|uniref:hypothetical protein n=1 Tax=Prosthecobacter sp. TaxID=1965333 RepID=UPI0037839690
MKSQKINNRAPRPFKNKADRWSGGNSQGFIPASAKPVQRPAKSAAQNPAKPADQAAAGE